MEIINPKFIELNQYRSTLYPNSEVFTPAYFGLALSEESGEYAGVIKKLLRGFNPREEKKIKKDYEAYIQQWCLDSSPVSIEEFWRIKQKAKAADELADIFIYTTLAAKALAIDLNGAITRKFNQVSEEMNIDIII